MSIPASRIFASFAIATSLLVTAAAQVAPRADVPGPSMAERVGADDGFGLIVTASADGKGSLEMCGCGRNPLGGLPRRVGYELAVVEATHGKAGLMRVDAGGAFDDTVDTGKNEVIPHIRNEWVLRGFLARDVAAINVAVSDLGYLSQMNVVEDRATRVSRFPMLDRVVSANVVPSGKGIVPFRPYVVRDVPAPRLGDKPIRVAIIGVSVVSPAHGAETYGYTIAEPAASISVLLPEVRKLADIVVLLAYAPVDRARAIVEAVPGIDMVFVANNFFPNGEVASNVGAVPLAPVVLQSRSLTEIRAWRSETGAWRFTPRSVVLDALIPSDPETLEMVYRARADYIR